MDQKELEQITRTRIAKNAYMNYNHLELVFITPEYCECRLIVRPESTNHYGFVHGGALFSLADVTAGSLAHADGHRHVTQNASFHNIGNQKDGIITCRASITNRGRTTCLVSVRVTGTGGKLLAVGEFTYFCIGE